MKMTDNSMNEVSLSYTETFDALSNRIRAHKKYSNFSLEDWIDNNISFSTGDAILDIGCGSGNLFPAYSDKIGEKGMIVGIDQSYELLEKASTIKAISSVVLLKSDINQPFPLISESVNHVISTFAIYYVEDPILVLGEIKRVLKNTGQVILIGPTDKNASELYQFNKTIFGFDRDEKVITRTNRIEKEFQPYVDSLFNNVCVEKIHSKLIFPSKQEFIEYYMSTLLFEESVIKYGVKPTMTELLSKELIGTELSKEMVVLRGEKIVEKNCSIYR